MDLWVFGYGSLIWNPGFAPLEAVPARLDGWRRSFCMRSIHHRGSILEPGLVLALDEAEGAACSGIAFRVDPQDEAPVLAALRERELVSSAYLEAVLPLALSDGRRIEALAYVIDRAHVQYCGGLSAEDQAQIIAKATGGRGPNDEYLHRTVEQLEALGLADPELDRLGQRVRALKGARAEG